jgi:hypothetical protein
MYLFFYSKHCKYSTKFLEFVKKIHYESYFEMVSVDKVDGQRHPFVAKYNIKEVPSIIVDQRIYSGKESFKWLQSKIKNANNAVPTQSVRQNKIPHISAYTPELSSLGIGEEQAFDGNSRYCALGLNNRIETPGESENVSKSTFVLPQDTITGNLETKDVSGKNEKSDLLKMEYEKLQQQMLQQNSLFKNMNKNAF